MEPEGLLALAAAPVGGGKAWPCFEMTRRSPAVWRAPVEAHGLLSLAAAPMGSGKAWPCFEMTRRSPAARRAPVEPHGLLGLAAAPVGGGRAWPGFEIDHSEPLGSRVAISRAGRRPRAHQAARPSNKHNNGGASHPPTPPFRPLREEPRHALRAWRPRS